MAQAIEARADDAPWRGASRLSRARRMPRPLPSPQAPAPRPPSRCRCTRISPRSKPEWRAFEQDADATAFQSFGWLAAWYRHIGAPAGVRPAIVSARGGDGSLLLRCRSRSSPGWCGASRSSAAICRLQRAAARARIRGARVARALPRAVGARSARCCSAGRAASRHRRADQNAETVGAQANPCSPSRSALNPSGAHLAHLGATWDEYYRDGGRRRRAGATAPSARSSANTEPCAWSSRASADDAAPTFETLIAQKSRRSRAWASPTCSRGRAARSSSSTSPPIPTRATWCT